MIGKDEGITQIDLNDDRAAGYLRNATPLNQRVRRRNNLRPASGLSSRLTTASHVTGLPLSVSSKSSSPYSSSESSQTVEVKANSIAPLPNSLSPLAVCFQFITAGLATGERRPL
jgi:hypothetical protein